MTFQDFLKSKIATGLLGVVLVLVMVIAARVLIQKHQIDKEVAKLQTQADKVKKDNEQLASLIKYFDTPQYQEKQAREKLNLKKDGEFVVGLPNASGTDLSTQVQSSQKSNPKQWFDYFFSHE